jgi:hypothetical protein
MIEVLLRRFLLLMMKRIITSSGRLYQRCYETVHIGNLQFAVHMSSTLRASSWQGGTGREGSRWLSDLTVVA